MATTSQYRAIFGMAKSRGISDEILRDILKNHFKKKTFKDLNIEDAKEFIDLLIKLNPSLKKRKKKKQYSKNIFQFITPKQIKFILTFSDSMDWSESNINKLVSRMFPRIKDIHDKIGLEVSFRRLSVEQAQSLIEAIKNIQNRAKVI